MNRTKRLLFFLVPQVCFYLVKTYLEWGWLWWSGMGGWTSTERLELLVSWVVFTLLVSVMIYVLWSLYTDVE